jgi:DNA modification methylase
MKDTRKNEAMRKTTSVEHIDYAIIAQPHTPMYLIHKYWARKPHNVVSEYIRRYSKEGEIVLDPFGGSGVTAMEAIKAGRKAISIDLNPISAFLIENTLSQVSSQEIEKEFRKIEIKLKDKINELYKTTCPKCHQKAIVLATIWERDKEVPLELRCLCHICNKYASTPKQKDMDLLQRIGKLKPKWYPKNELAYDGNKFMKREGKETVSELFTKRNLCALSALLQEIEKVEKRKLRGVFKLAFSSMIHLASNMCPVAKTGGKGHWSALSATSFWALQSYWTPPVYMESNVWMLFESAVFGKQGVLKGKADAAEQIKLYKRAKKLQELDDGANILFETANVLELTKILPTNSVDYIFTDPPYGGAVQYFELSTLWAAWLGMDLNYADEITINNQQEKDFEYYHKMLKAAFREMYQVLKPGRYLTVTFHSTEIAVWNSIIKAVVLSGFDLEKIIYQPPARPSAKGLLQPYGSAVGDYYIRFRKPETEKKLLERDTDKETYEREVVWAAKAMIEWRGEPTIYQRILNGIMSVLEGGRNVPVGARNIEDVLKDHVGKEFELIDIKNAKGKKGKAWWLKGRDFTNFSTPSLSDRVEKMVLLVLDRKVKASFDDVLQEIFIEFPNALTPDTEDIIPILKEYADKTSDGSWMLKPQSQASRRETIHNLMVYHLANLGKKAGYKVWIGSQEQKFCIKDKPLSEMCDRVPVLRFVPQDSISLDRIRQIDVLWLKDDKIKYEFEVENTTGISEAIIRGSNIPQELNPKRYIIIPNERERFLFRKIQEPILAETIKKAKWNFIRYDDLERVAKASGKTFQASDLEVVAKMPKEGHVQKQLFLI